MRAALIAAALVVVAASGVLGSAGTSLIGLVGAGAVASLIIGASRLPAGARHPWIIIAVGSVLTLTAAGIREQLHTLGDRTGTRSFLPDLFSAPGYILLAVGLGCALRIRRRDVGGRLDSVLDGCLAGLAVFVLGWVFVLYPATQQEVASLGVTLSIISYPPISIIFVVLTAELAFARGSRRGISILGGLVAMSFLLIGDVFFTSTDAGIATVPDWLTLLPYGFAYSAMIFFALHPTFVEFAEPLPADNAPPSAGRLALVAASLSIPPLVGAVHTTRDATDRTILVSSTILLTVLATTRVVRALFQHAKSEQVLRYQATHDLLTGVYNRSGLLEKLEELALLGVPHAVLFIDMDRFKLVNDAFGHHIGDELLMHVTNQVRTVCDDTETIGRIGGDEFVIITTGHRSVDAVVAFAEEIRSATSSTVAIGGNEIPVSFSIGLTVADNEQLPEDLLREADTAMYRAKEAGRDAIMVFDHSMTDRVAKRLELESELRNALPRNELEVHYQPVVDIMTGRTVGFEALMRWNHPTRGTVPPLDFIPIAEETGLIIEIGAWILDRATEDLSRWRQTEPFADDLWVSVNVSARQLLDSDFVFMVQRALNRNRLDASALTLELTESMLIDEALMMPRVLGKIRDVGVKLSIDDFGTGYSSLAYVQRYPFNCVKIDRAFVEFLDDSTGGEHQLVGAIVAMADALELSTIAEGVETLAQAERLVELGCRTAQGYYYSRPVPAELIPDTLRRLGTHKRPALVSRG